MSVDALAWNPGGGKRVFGEDGGRLGGILSRGSSVEAAWLWRRC
jgi:hypothetical protein